MDCNDWIWLNISCPIEGCDNNIEEYWTHINCPNNKNENDLKINSSGYIKCEGCGIRSELIKWNFFCGNKHGFKSIKNLNRLFEVLQVMAKRATDQTFIVRLMGNISIMFLNDEKQFNNDILKCVPSKLEKNNLAKKFNSEMVKEGKHTF